jgi:hypothetical protein
VTKHNPKHQKKKVKYSRQQNLGGSNFPWRYVLMAVIFVGVFTAVIYAVVTMGDGQSDEVDDVIKIEDGDTAEIEYKLWPDADHDGVINWQDTDPVQDATFTTEVKKGSLINGFYNKLLGMKIGGTDTFFLDANVDANGDGVDDITGEDIVSYGSPGHDLFNTSLVFWVRIVNITKLVEPEITTTDSLSNDMPTQLLIFNNLWLINDIEKLLFLI